MIKTSEELADRLVALEAATGKDGYGDLYAQFIEDITPAMDLDSTNRQAIELVLGIVDPVPGKQAEVKYDEQDDFCKSLLAFMALSKSGVTTVRDGKSNIARDAYLEAMKYFMNGHIPEPSMSWRE